MTTLPKSTSSLLVRTAFADNGAWDRLTTAVATENQDGFRAYVDLVDDSAWGSATWQSVRAAVPANDEGASVLFIADGTALGSQEFPILVVDLLHEEAPFRCTAAELWGVENNLNISNMDWIDFAGAVDAEGVFRGF